MGLGFLANPQQDDGLATSVKEGLLLLLFSSPFSFFSFKSRSKILLESWRRGSHLQGGVGGRDGIG